jgi:hypothetical protein
MVKVQPSYHRHASTRQGSKMPHQECTPPPPLLLAKKVDTNSRPDNPNGPVSSGTANLKKLSKAGLCPMMLLDYKVLDDC